VTSSVDQALARLFDQFIGRADVSILEVGCGMGERLVAAAQRGWRCFGVEASASARTEARQRLGDTAYVVAAIGDLFAHKFDVVVTASGASYEMFYQLFSVGAIAPETLALVGGAPGMRDVLRRLRFTAIDGADVLTATGSDFQSFMQERYVPGTWSRIAAYEHIPRYSLAKPLAAGKAVLDFGCGTGYGAAMLAETAREVTGLDIDESALVWAREANPRANLTFTCRDDLGTSLPEASFDLITCFEMIEHVDFATQQRVITSLARLLKPDGLFLISTPNPDVTKLYGVNPYHVREMTEPELRALVTPHFAHVSVLGQHVRAGVTFSQGAEPSTLRPASMIAGERAEHPMAFIAICSRAPLKDVADSVFFDDGSNYVGDFIGHERKLQEARADAYSQRGHTRSAETQYRIMSAQRNDAVIQMNQAIAAKNEMHDARYHFEHEYERYKREYEVKVEQVALITKMRDEDRQTYEEQMRSPRFLARNLWHATWARVRAKLKI
jgi:2-polyprenyl-3-methyl-5-hydroxy-6-metoxy-1,4-benzoquinol methylase